MKRILILLAIVLVEINCYAQWFKKNIEGDEFAGTTSNTTYYYISPETNGTCAFYQTKDGKYSQIVVSINQGIFDYSSQNVMAGKVGLFDSDGNIIKKWGNRSFKISNNGSQATPMGISDRIIKHLLEEKGYVRIILKKYNGGNLDIVIPCIEDVTIIEELPSNDEE